MSDFFSRPRVVASVNILVFAGLAALPSLFNPRPKGDFLTMWYGIAGLFILFWIGVIIVNPRNPRSPDDR